MGKLAPNILKTAAVGKHSEDGGLQLRVTSVGSNGTRKGSWYFRYTFQGRQQEIGLGSIKKLNLKQARAERDRYADMMADRRNPVNPKDAKRAEREDAQAEASVPTLRDVADLAFEAKKGSLKGDGTAGRWMSPLEHHILPLLGQLPIDQIGRNQIVRCLTPIWKSKPATSKKAIERLGIVLRHGRAMGLKVDALAIDDAKQLLGAQGHTPRHHPALPFSDAPKLYRALDPQSVVQRALAFYLLAGGGPRIKPVLSMRYDEIVDNIWTIPGTGMKAQRGKEEDFRIPLTQCMMELVQISKDQSHEDDTLVFRSPNRSRRGETAVTDQALENVMRRFEEDWAWPAPYRLHGLRATFRTWVSNRDPSLYAVAETALAHKVGGMVERSYMRNDFLEERRELLEAWAAYLTKSVSDERS